MSSPSPRPELKIRLAGPGDEETVSKLLYDAFLQYKDLFTPSGFAETTASPDIIRERFEKGSVWLAFFGGKAVGTVTALTEPDKIYMCSMAVSPAAQGQGVGQRLLENLEDDARRRGCKRIYLYTTFVLSAAQPLYEKNGFRVVRETPPEEWHSMGGVEMEKILVLFA